MFLLNQCELKNDKVYIIFTIQNVSIKFDTDKIFLHRFKEFTIQNVSIKSISLILHLSASSKFTIQNVSIKYVKL